MKKLKNILTAMILLLCAITAIACMYPNNPLPDGINAGDGEQLTGTGIGGGEGSGSGSGGGVGSGAEWGNDDPAPDDPHGNDWLDDLTDDGWDTIYDLPPADPNTSGPDDWIGGDPHNEIFIDPEGNVIPSPTIPDPPTIPDADDIDDMLDDMDWEDVAPDWDEEFPDETEDETDEKFIKFKDIDLPTGGKSKSKTTTDPNGKITGIQSTDTTTDTGDDGSNTTTEKSTDIDGDGNVTGEKETKTTIDPDGGKKTEIVEKDPEGKIAGTKNETTPDGSQTTTEKYTTTPGEIRTTTVTPNDGGGSTSETTIGDGKGNITGYETTVVTPNDGGGSTTETTKKDQEGNVTGYVTIIVPPGDDPEIEIIEKDPDGPPKTCISIGPGRLVRPEEPLVMEYGGTETGSTVYHAPNGDEYTIFTERDKKKNVVGSAVVIHRISADGQNVKITTIRDGRGNIISSTTVTAVPDGNGGEQITTEKKDGSGNSLQPATTGHVYKTGDNSWMSDYSTYDAQGNLLRVNKKWTAEGNITSCEITTHDADNNVVSTGSEIRTSQNDSSRVIQVKIWDADGILTEDRTEYQYAPSDNLIYTVAPVVDSAENIFAINVTYSDEYGNVLYSRTDPGMAATANVKLAVKLRAGKNGTGYYIQISRTGKVVTTPIYDENKKQIGNLNQKFDPNGKLIEEIETISKTNPDGSVTTTRKQTIVLPDGSTEVFNDSTTSNTTISTTVENDTGSVITTTDSDGKILAVTYIQTFPGEDGSITTVKTKDAYVDGVPVERLYKDSITEEFRSFTDDVGNSISEIKAKTVEWVNDVLAAGVGHFTGNGYVVTETVTVETVGDGSKTIEKNTSQTLLSPEGKILTGPVQMAYRKSRTGGDGDYEYVNQLRPVTVEENGILVIRYPDGSTALATKKNVTLGRFTIQQTGLWEVASRPVTPRIRMETVKGSDGTNTMRITYSNGQSVPFPVSPAIRMAKRTKASTQVTGDKLPLKYERAELWYKILPQGTETEKSVWRKIKEVTGEQLNRHVVDAPLKVFGSVDVPGITAGDEVLFLLYLVDEDGEASGEPLVDGAREPVIALPDTKESTLNKVSSDQDINETGHATPFLMRVRYNGKRSLK